ncbi:MAG: SDR family oxidoreductase [Coxiellaceae bacterium]|nr:SDR family oxidoreductase [Coxiellaceae bacterium]
MTTVLVTGAGGYIGSVLTPKLLDQGYQVKAVDRFFFGEDKLKQHEHLEIVREDARRLTPTHFADVDFVIDLVAISNDPAGEAFDTATWAINHQARANTAQMAKQAGVKRYILPSSCSIYGFQDHLVDETADTNPLTTYAKANEKAENDVLPLADDNFVVTVMRQSTVFGYSPRMRFDLAINGMTYGAWHTKKLPLMRDGQQYRPMVHVQDTTDVMALLLKADAEKINGQIFNVGGEALNYQIGPLAEIITKMVAKRIGEPVEIEWYGDVDHRSYQVNFSKIKNTLDWTPQWDAERGASEILEKLISGELLRTTQTITLDWYKALEQWSAIVKQTELHGGMVNIV